jgi:hypothetical protein
MMAKERDSSSINLSLRELPTREGENPATAPTRGSKDFTIPLIQPGGGIQSASVVKITSPVLSRRPYKMAFFLGLETKPLSVVRTNFIIAILGILLCYQRLQTGSDISLFVPGGDDHRDPRTPTRVAFFEATQSDKNKDQKKRVTNCQNNKEVEKNIEKQQNFPSELRVDDLFQ